MEDRGKESSSTAPGRATPASRFKTRWYSASFLLGFGLLLVSAIVTYWNGLAVREARALVDRSQAVRSTLEAAASHLHEAEAAARGHLLRPHERERERFTKARADLDQSFGRLESLITVAHQRRRLGRLEALVSGRMGHLEGAIRSQPSAGGPPWDHGAGISLDRIEGLFGEMRVASAAIREQREKALATGRVWRDVVAWSSFVVAFAALALGLGWILRLVREREAALAELAIKEADFRASFDVTPTGAAQVDPETGIFLKVNRKLCEITGYDAPELLRMTVEELTHPDDRARDREAREPFFRHEVERYESEKRYVRKDGKVIWVSVGAAMLPETTGRSRRAITAVTDITARRLAEDLLYERIIVDSVKAEVGAALGRGQALADVLQRALSPIVERMDLASAQVWTLDGGASFLDLIAAAGPLGLPPREMSRLAVGEWLIGRVAATRRQHATNALGQDPQYLDGSWFDRGSLSAFAGYPLQVGGETLGVLAVFSRRMLSDFEIDALRLIAVEAAWAVHHERTETERAELLRAAQQARHTAEASSRAKDDFLSILSHELRTPLNAVLGWTELLRMGAVEPEEVDGALETIEQNAVRQSQLIGDILDISRVVEGRLKLDTASASLQEILQAAVDTVQHAAIAKSVDLRVRVEATPAMVVDATRIQQVLWNLLSNAIKFTPKYGTVEVSLEDAGSHARLVVRDDGRGISPEFLPRLFERFTQEDSSSTRSQTGLGLGMAIVRHLVELHGGSVEAASEGLDRGATFTVKLPYSARAAEVPPTDQQPAPVAEIDLSGKPLNELRVLVVDDEEDSLRAVQRGLGFYGAVVVTATSASDALRKLADRPPDVLVSDVAMPGEDGYALIRQVRARSSGEGGCIPAVALTAFASAEDQRKLLAAGFQVHLAKPIEPRRLASTIAKLVG